MWLVRWLFVILLDITLSIFYILWSIPAWLVSKLVDKALPPE